MHPSNSPKLLCMQLADTCKSEVGVRMSNFLLGGRGEDDFTENVITACALFIAIVIIPRLARTSPLRDNLCIPSVGCLDAALAPSRSRPTTSRYSLAQRQAVPLHSHAPESVVMLFDVCAPALSISARRTHYENVYIFICWCQRVSAALGRLYTRRRRKIIRECNPQCVHLPRDECAFVLSLISHAGGGGRAPRCCWDARGWVLFDCCRVRPN